jgi:hypothetical protein
MVLGHSEFGNLFLFQNLVSILHGTALIIISMTYGRGLHLSFSFVFFVLLDELVYKLYARAHNVVCDNATVSLPRT